MILSILLLIANDCQSSLCPSLLNDDKWVLIISNQSMLRQRIWLCQTIETIIVNQQSINLRIKLYRLLRQFLGVFSKWVLIKRITPCLERRVMFSLFKQSLGHGPMGIRSFTSDHRRKAVSPESSPWSNLRKSRVHVL